MNSILENARRASLAKQEILSKRWAEKKPKDRSASRRKKKGAKRK